MQPEPMVLCPVCRVAIPDREYYAHARTHQKGYVNLAYAIAAFALACIWWVGFAYLVALVIGMAR